MEVQFDNFYVNKLENIVNRVKEILSTHKEAYDNNSNKMIDQNQGSVSSSQESQEGLSYPISLIDNDKEKTFLEKNRYQEVSHDQPNPQVIINQSGSNIKVQQTKTYYFGKLCSQKEGQYIIDKAIQNIEQRYDFKFNNIKYNSRLKEISHKRRGLIQRQLKMKYSCYNQDSKKGSKCNQWTSYYGLTHIIFYFDRYNDTKNIKRTYPYKLYYKLKFYKQICQQCSEWVTPRVEKTEIVSIAKEFCNAIVKILDFKHCKPHKKINLDQIYDNQKKSKHKIGYHQAKYCEACLDGYCKYKKQQ